jgi:hypothetical protein
MKSNSSVFRTGLSLSLFRFGLSFLDVHTLTRPHHVFVLSVAYPSFVICVIRSFISGFLACFIGRVWLSVSIQCITIVHVLRTRTIHVPAGYFHQLCSRQSQKWCGVTNPFLINDTDWELEGEGAYQLKSGDEIVSLPTLHGG